MSPADELAAFDEILVEIFGDLDSGGRPDVEALVARHPNFEKQIRGFFEDYDFLDGEFTAGRARAAPLWSSIAGTEAAPGSAAAIRASESTDLPRIGRFTLLEELSAGSQGIVYKAEQSGTKRIVALKVIRAGALATASERRRFRAEIEIISRLNHPHIVSVYECGRVDERDYFAMEFVDGEPLDQYHANRTLEVADSLRLFLQIGDAVSHAHQHGVIHRDLKPSNVLIDREGRARVLDFGLARPVQEDSGRTMLTQVGDFAGTWPYASPEQARRDPALVDVRSDVYSLGVILYEMLTDFLPYPVSGEPPDTIARHITETAPVPPRSVRQDLDDDLETIVLCALRKEPERRYQSVAALAADIRSYLAGEAIAAKRDHALYVARKTIRRFRWQLAVGGATLIAVIAYAVTFSVLYARMKTAKATAEVRSEVVRDSQRYLLGKLDQLSAAQTVLREAAEAAPNLPSVRRLQKPEREFPAARIRDLVNTAPPGFIAPAGQPSEFNEQAVAVWLTEHEDQLDELERTANEVRFTFPDTTNIGGVPMFHDFAGDLAGTVGLCRALCARATRALEAGEADQAIRSLSAVRSLALDQGDNRWMFVRIAGVSCRSRVYDVALASFSGNGDTAENMPLANWILTDPPLSSLSGGLILERERYAQLYESATSADPRDQTPYLDVDTLNRLIPGGFSVDGAALRTLGCNTQPAAALELLDDYVTTLAAFDDYSHDKMQSALEALMARLNKAPAFPLIHRMLPSVHRMFHVRGRVASKRTATHIMARLVQFRHEHGRWPDSLASLASNVALRTIDPYVDAPFQYRLVDGQPVLYSLNVDRIDNDGKPGYWAQPDTDLLYVPFDATLQE